MPGESKRWYFMTLLQMGTGDLLANPPQPHEIDTDRERLTDLAKARRLLSIVAGDVVNFVLLRGQ
jgi:hypothetical protein